MTPLKTLQIDSEMNWGGGQRQVSGLCSYLRDQGHTVKIVCRPGSELRRWAHDSGIEAIPMEMRSTISLWAVLNLRSVILREQPDIVHLHASRAHVLGSVAAHLAPAKVVIATRRNADPIHMLWPNTSAYGKWTTAIVAISSTVRDMLIQCGVSQSKIRLIESGVDISRFEAVTPDRGLRAFLGVAETVPLVCAAATLGPHKGIEYLIKAAALLKARSTPVYLIIAGDGDQRPELERLAREMGVAASFVGFQRDMPSLLSAIDVFAMPSLGEGLGVAVLEAMAAGKPVVASAVGGLCESVLDGSTGCLVPPADEEALAEAIGKLLANPQMAAQFGAAGRARARSIYSLENMASRNESLYYELLNPNAEFDSASVIR